MRLTCVAMTLLAWPTFSSAQNAIHLEAEAAQLVGGNTGRIYGANELGRIYNGSAVINRK